MANPIKINAAPLHAGVLSMQLAALQSQTIGTVSFPCEPGEAPYELAHLATEICVLDSQLTALIEETAALLSSTVSRFSEADADLADSVSH